MHIEINQPIMRAGDPHYAPGRAHNAAAGGPPPTPAHLARGLAGRANGMHHGRGAGGRGRKEEEYFEGEGEERGRKEEYIEGEGEERGRKEEEYIEGEGEERGRKEDEQCEGEQGERRAGRGSGQLVVSGGWKAGGRGRGKWPFWAVLYWPHRWALLLLAVMFLGESMLHVVKAVLLYRIIAFLEACDSSSSSDGSSCVEGQCGSIEGYLTAAGLGALAVALAVATQHLCYRAYVSPPPSDPSTSPSSQPLPPKLGQTAFAYFRPSPHPSPNCSPHTGLPPLPSHTFHLLLFPCSAPPPPHTHRQRAEPRQQWALYQTCCPMTVRRLDDLVFCSQALWVVRRSARLGVVPGMGDGEWGSCVGHVAGSEEIGWVPTIAGHCHSTAASSATGSCFLSPTCTLLSPSQTTEQYQLACGKWRVWLRAKTAEATDARVKHTEEVGGWGGGRGKEWGWGRGRGGLDGGGEERGWVREGRRGVGLQWTAALNAVTAALYFSFTSVVAFESSINPLHPPFPLPYTSLQWTAALNAVTAAL
ncbi:unnamed protein product [Closterium sp. Naga37s-1]|nr:unnamed protein product [Closterium sp. Naga37s-1]